MTKTSHPKSRDLLAEASPNLFKQIIAQTADGVVAIDGAGKIIMFNHASEQMFGLWAQDVLGQPLEILLPQEARHGHPAKVDRFAKSKSSSRRMSERAANLTGLRADGTNFPVGITIQKVLSGGETILVAQIRDRTERVKLEQDLQRMAETDPLTGAFNRRAFVDRLHHIHKASVSARSPYALLLLDLDHFKDVNDTFGHNVGDKILLAFAEQCQKMLRSKDLFARWGGEEFIAVLPETELSAGAAIGERIRARIANHIFAKVAPVDFRLTVSVGIAGCASCEQLPDLLIAKADKALYRAKADGRNRVFWESARSNKSSSIKPHLRIAQK